MKKRARKKRRRQSKSPPSDIHNFVIFADVYNEAQVLIFRTLDRYNAWRRKRGATEEKRGGTNACAGVHTDPDGIDWFIAYIPDKCSKETVCHECLHLAWYILDSYGVKVSVNNQEPLAYLMQHLARQVFRHRNQ